MLIAQARALPATTTKCTAGHAISATVKAMCSVSQLYRRLPNEQSGSFLKQYQTGSLTRATAQQTLGVAKTRPFALLKEYEHHRATVCLRSASRCL